MSAGSKIRLQSQETWHLTLILSFLWCVMHTRRRETATKGLILELFFIGFILFISSDVDLTWLFPLDYFCLLYTVLSASKHHITVLKKQMISKGNWQLSEAKNITTRCFSFLCVCVRVCVCVCVCARVCASLVLSTGFLASSVVKNLPVNAGDMRHRFDPWVRKIPPWRRKWQPTLVFLPGESQGQRSLEGYSPRGSQELDTTEQPNNSIINKD